MGINPFNVTVVQITVSFRDEPDVGRSASVPNIDLPPGFGTQNTTVRGQRIPQREDGN